MSRLTDRLPVGPGLAGLVRWVVAAVLAAGGACVCAQLPLQRPDSDLRDRIARARDDGRLAAPALMWPVTRATVRAAAAEDAACNARASIDAQAAEGSRVILGFGDGAPVDRRLSVTICPQRAGPLALAPRLNVEQSSGNREAHVDGSFVAFEWGGALLLGGAIERFWGPGWAGSLILADNARPVPAIAIRRADPTRAFESRWLSWLGPWDAEAFFGRLQGHSEPRSPQFFGMRAEAAPFPWLAIGASRTLQWGGEGRSNSLRTWFDAFIGRDNVGGGGITEANEPGNQLAGFDVRVSAVPLGIPLAVYTQWIGEDEAGFMPYKYMTTSGIETWFEAMRGRWRAVFEYVDTVVGLHDEYPGTAYNHHIFRQGYTQRGRSLGFGLGGDIRAAVAQIHVFGHTGASASLQVLSGRANPGAVASRRFAPDSLLQGAELRARYAMRPFGSLEARLGEARFTPWAGSPVRSRTVGLGIVLRLP